VRATNDKEVHEWDILVEVEINVIFHASHAFRVPRSKQEGVPCLITD
jgi:ABC-type sulfate transport system substrate-binding protein